MNEDLPAVRAPVSLDHISRESVRALVASDSTYVLQAHAAGRNVHQVSLDRQDQINAYMATLSEDDLQRFLTLYLEEMNASTRAALDTTAALNASTAEKQMQTAMQASQFGVCIALIVFFVFLISAIKMYG
jgi:hypothetical protein